MSFVEVATVGSNVTAYSGSGLLAATLYYYRVRAVDSGGDSPYSNTASATTLGTGATIPAAPSNLVATSVAGPAVALAWGDNSNNEQGFKIERSLDGATFTQIATVGANVASYTDSAVTGLTRYYYRVRSYNNAGNSAYSNTTSARTGRR